MLRDVRVFVTVAAFIGAVDVRVAVDMGMLMGMDLIPVAVFVGVGVAVLVGMLQADGILHHQNRGGDHYGKTQIKLHAGPFPQQGHAEEYAQEGGDGIVGTGFGGTQAGLGLDIEIDAEAVGHKAQQQDCAQESKTGELFSQDQGYHQAAQAGESALNGGDLYGGFGTEHPGTVILQTPAAGGTQHQQGAGVETEGTLALEAQNGAGQGHQGYSQSQPMGQLLTEEEEGDGRGGHDLKIVQQRCVGAAAVL